ncbi:Hypothetical predicted protein [Cloeon dipterum]|uniref:Dual specificity protein phosphatase 23 n=1 Tax=Cloeon dipterum TaxID=197152 RepID=A0A8S1D6A6_9INSE|nr:Hypothetical predicted protein [Cloeon dipterum]
MSEAPWNFSWVVPEELCVFACPGSRANVRFLVDSARVRHLVTLSQSHRPPPDALTDSPELQWTLIDVREFEPPTLQQMQQFIDICQKARDQNQAVGVHCRMGRGRSGVMAACYLLHFCHLTPGTAVANLRLQRPGSVETYAQERAVHAYFDYIRSL